MIFGCRTVPQTRFLPALGDFAQTLQTCVALCSTIDVVIF